MTDMPLDLAPPPRFAAWLLDPMRRNFGIYARVAVAAAMINLFGLAGSFFSMTVYDRVIPNDALSSLAALSIGLVIVVIFDFLLRSLRAYFVDIAGSAIDQEVGAALFDRLLALRLDQRRGSDGALTGLMREFETLRDFFASATLTALVDVPFILITLLVIGAIGGWIVMVPATLIPVILLAGWLTQPAIDRLSAQVLENGLSKQSVLVETIGNLETVKAVGAGTLLLPRWLRAVRGHASSGLRQRLVSAIAVNVATAANTLSYAGVVVFGATMIADRSLTTGGLIACSILSGRAIAPLAQIASLMSRLAGMRTAYRQIDRIMSLPAEGPAREALKPQRVDGAIEFRAVCFRYPGAPKRALNDVSFSIAAGERIAIVGRVGSGKSTIARLVLGLYPTEDGNVLIDGTDLRQYDPTSLRRHMGVVMQDSGLFSGSVRENILLGRSGEDDAELLRVAGISGTHHFMGALANGYELSLGDRGAGLSGGQRQSIAMARALVGRPSLLLFDEPSSAMDSQTESGLLDRLSEECVGRTLILITHRPALLRLVDRILVLDQGRVIADGAREKVLRQLMGVKAA